MPLHNPPYESVYGVALLDDLHNYFPAVLYEPSSFQSVRDLLTYISVRTRRRFDLYSNAINSYHEGSPVPSSGVAGRVASNSPTQYTAASSYAATAAAATAATERAIPADIGLRRNLSIPATSSVLGALLAGLSDLNEVDSNSVYRILLTPPVPRASRAFMEPVVIRPSQEQITAATRIGTPNDPTEVCAICQETIENNQPARLILHCDHWFHTNCIDVWFEQNVHCPVCRHDIRLISAGQPSAGQPSAGQPSAGQPSAGQPSAATTTDEGEQI